MEKQRKSAKLWLIIASVLMIISMFGASRVQDSGGDVVIKDLRWENESGLLMSAYLLIPKTATKDNPAPAIVTSHGWYNNREMQDLNYVEYARRGYVVMSIDMQGHGNSEPFKGESGFNDAPGTGMYSAVQMLATLPYVDKAKIGVTGHSNGARACNLSVEEDNKRGAHLIAAVLLVANDAYYANPLNSDNYYNMYGDRSIGIIAAQYDEFFFRRLKEDGTRTVPREYIQSVDAQSFLHFGVNPIGLDKRESGTFYDQMIDGKEAVRVIWQPDQIHPWNHFSKECVTHGVTFFEKVFGAPHPIPPENQVWQWKVFFNAVGLVAFMIFFVSFAVMMLWTPAFASLRASEVVQPLPAPKGAAMVWFWITLLIATAIGFFAYIPALKSTYAMFEGFLPRNETLFPQPAPYGIGLWAAMCGIGAIILMVISYLAFGKNNGIDLKAVGIRMPLRKFCKTVLLAIIVVAVTYLWVFVSQYFFKVDFRIWVLTIKAFTPDKLAIAMPYLVLFLIYYVTNSIAINSFNYNRVGNKEWVNILILALFNSLASILIVLIQYHTFFDTGELWRGYWTTPKVGAMALGGIWQFPIIIILFVAAIISRKIYRVTGNPYLAGFMNGILITIYSCTNTLTIWPL